MIEFTRSMQITIRLVKISSFHAKYPNGYYCEKCGCTITKRFLHAIMYILLKMCHQSCLFAGTIFQDCKLNLYKLLLGLFIFYFNKGVSAMEMRSQPDVTTRLHYCCAEKRVLTTECNSEKILDNIFGGN